MLELIELGAFKPEKLNDARRFLKLIPDEFEPQSAVEAAWTRVFSLEATMFADCL